MNGRRDKLVRLGVVGLLVAATAVAGAGPSAAAADDPSDYPGSLPATGSARTYCVVADVSAAVPDGCTDVVQATTDALGAMPYAGLRIFVNQTTDLNTQAVSVNYSWADHVSAKGANSAFGNTGVAANFMRVMQCWGDPVTSTVGDPADLTQAQNVNYVASNQGPPRENCEYGGLSVSGVPNVATYNNQTSRVGTPMFGKTPTLGDETVYTDPATNGYEVPFDAADGGTVPHEVGTLNNYTTILNPYFNQTSTNEQVSDPLFAGGVGGTQFQVQNASDSRGLGCGVTRLGGGSANRCWLVVVPQAATGLDGKPLALKGGTSYLPSAFGSPVASTNWANRIAIPLNFNPVVSACVGKTSSYQTFGSTLVNNAVLSWENKLCGTSGVDFDYSQGTDTIARSQLASGSTALQFVSDPVAPDAASSPITYAPVTLSGLAIGFVWDHATQQFQRGPGYVNQGPVTGGVPIPTIKLNARLVAKLLTYSYVEANSYRNDPNTTFAEQSPPLDSYQQWLGKQSSYNPLGVQPGGNPAWIGSDPEFWSLNPDFAPSTPDKEGNFYGLQDVGISYLQGPLFGSDAITRLWQWVMADPEARTFMAGVSDPWGTHVDPWFSTSADVNPSGEPFDPTTTDGLPYADPWQGVPGGKNIECPQNPPPTLAFSDIRPQASDLSGVARNILGYTVLGKTTYRCATDEAGNPPGWISSRTQSVVVPGNRGLAGLTDTASGSQYGVTYASLQTAPGTPATATTDAKAPTFVAPTAASLAAAAGNLTSTDVSGVSQPVLGGTTGADPAAYPLALLTYAGVTTNGMSSDACSAFATFLDYAAGAGQQSGTAAGDLPAGYYPLPATLRAQTSAAARTVAACAQVPAADSGDTNVDETLPPVDTGGSSSAFADDTPADTGSGAPASSSGSSAPQVSLASSQTKPDPSVFAYVVPIAALVGLLAVLAAPLAGLRRRRTGSPE